MLLDMAEPNIEPSTLRDQLLKLIRSLGYDDEAKMASMEARTPTEYLPGILERYIKAERARTLEAGVLKGLNEAALHIGLLNTFNTSAEARAAIKAQYAKLQEQREKDTMSTPDLLMEAAGILMEFTVKATKSSGFQTVAGENVSVGSDRSLREAVLSALKKAEFAKLTMAQHLAIKALIEKACG
jgi:hypothetical protein